MGTNTLKPIATINIFEDMASPVKFCLIIACVMKNSIKDITKQSWNIDFINIFLNLGWFSGRIQYSLLGMLFALSGNLFTIANIAIGKTDNTAINAIAMFLSAYL